MVVGIVLKGMEREGIWSVFVFKVAAVCNGVVTREFLILAEGSI